MARETRESGETLAGGASARGLSRRRFLGFALAAPVIVKASSLMAISPVAKWPNLYGVDVPRVIARVAQGPNYLLTMNMITKETVKLWKTNNWFLENIDTQYREAFSTRDPHAVRTTMKIRLPNKFVDRTRLR